ncbi:MAG: PD-(D/E)XK nuclease family protein, partial [Deltaproteobacteria bacterium]|nr:PD-(D/E)XK nuclease family protein [Deltaproteobacteria bacterium]
EVARHVGTLVHSLLQCAAQEGLERWTPGYARGLRESNRRALAALGTPEAQLEDALDRVGRALTFALDGQRGRWILAHRPGARSEFALAAVIDGQPRHLVIDRTFVDEDGVRWIIDYKTSAHLGGDLETFLKSEQERYRPQLERYAAAFRLLEPDIREVRLGLYFPLLDEWVQWEPRSPAGN